MTPNNWPVGTEYCVVRIVSHRAADGTPDPQIHERICLPSESRGLITNSMTRNPYATAYVERTATWRGLHGG
jgi:sirohydrochlorin ferrochelatase